MRTDPPARAHERAFRLLLRLYPRWFRDAYEDEMALLFLSRLDRAAGRRETLRLWIRTLVDAVVSATGVRFDDSRGGTRMTGMWHDIRYTARRLVRSPTFALGTVALLAIGIGFNTTSFALVDNLLFRPPPWVEPERVVHVYQDSDDGEPNANSFPATRDMAAYDQIFATVTATAPSSASWEGPDGPEPVYIEYVTSTYTAVTGRGVQRGRWFGPEHDVVGGPLAAVVSAATWRGRFGADPEIVGRVVRLNGLPVTIIGVGPEELTSTVPPLLTDFWLSISTTPVGGDFQVANLERRADHWYFALARLQPGVTVEQAQAAMDALAARLADDYPEMNRGRGITVFSSSDVRLHPQGDGGLAMAGGLLTAVALTVLLLACANLANLLLVRGLGRSGEMAVRSALGAPRGRVARLLLLESLMLAGLGGVVGLGLTWWALAALPSLPLAEALGGTLELGVDARVLVFALALMTLTGVLFGLAPAVRTARTDVSRALRDDRRGASSGRSTLRLRGALVTVQVAASLILVLGTGMLVRGLAALQARDPGLDVDRVAYAVLDWGRSGMSAEEARVATDELRQRLETMPGVERAALGTGLPAQIFWGTTTEIEGYVPAAGTPAVELPFAVVTDGYFETMGIPLVAGRLFGPEDVPGSGEFAVLVSETTARRFWGDADPIGRRMRGQGAEAWTRTVVGVVGDVPVRNLVEGPAPLFYFSSRQHGAIPTHLFTRAAGDAAAMLTPMRREVQGWRPSVTVAAQGTLASHFGERLATPRFAANAMLAFSVLALTLAGLGIYTVVSFTVARRAPELGVRIALGAERAGVVRMVVGEVLRVVGVGLGVGLLVSGVASSRLGTVLGVPALDPLTFGGAVLVLLIVSWIAAYVPARRAARADPVRTLTAA